MKKILITLMLTVPFAAYGDTKQIPTECSTLIQTLDELVVLSKQEITSSMMQPTEELVEIKTTILELLEKDPESVIRECNRYNDMFGLTLKLANEMSKKFKQPTAEKKESAKESTVVVKQIDKEFILKEDEIISQIKNTYKLSEKRALLPKFDELIDSAKDVSQICKNAVKAYKASTELQMKSDEAFAAQNSSEADKLNAEFRVQSNIHYELRKQCLGGEYSIDD